MYICEYVYIHIFRATQCPAYLLQNALYTLCGRQCAFCSAKTRIHIYVHVYIYMYMYTYICRCTYRWYTVQFLADRVHFVALKHTHTYMYIYIQIVKKAFCGLDTVSCPLYNLYVYIRMWVYVFLFLDRVHFVVDRGHFVKSIQSNALDTICMYIYIYTYMFFCLDRAYLVHVAVDRGHFVASIQSVCTYTYICICFFF